MAVRKFKKYLQKKMMDHCHSLVLDKEVDLNSVSSVYSFLLNWSGISCFGFRWQVQAYFVEINC